VRRLALVLAAVAAWSAASCRAWARRRAAGVRLDRADQPPRPAPGGRAGGLDHRAGDRRQPRRQAAYTRLIATAYCG